MRPPIAQHYDDVPPDPVLSPSVYVLTTSEGRDKIFKVVQYTLKLSVWIMLQRHVLPDGTAAFRAEWAERLAGNYLTVRNGRALFKLGRWAISFLDLKDALAELSRATSTPFDGAMNSKKWLLVGIVIRSVAAFLRNLLRDASHLFDKELFGFRRTALSVSHARRLHSAATALWLVIAALDVALATTRLWHAEWFPRGRSLQCRCQSDDTARLVFPRTDIERGCPSTRTVQFVKSVEPADMLVRCSECGETAAVGAASTWPASAHSSMPPLVLLPRTIRFVRDEYVVLRAHDNLRENILLLAKGVCDLTLALSTAMRPKRQDPYASFRNGIASCCGLASAMIALRRVAMEAV
jgi:hypothetical protein